jgi:hypothetical protein
MEVVPVDIAVKMLDTREEEGEGNRGRTDRYNNDNDGGDEEGDNCDNAHKQMILTSVIAGVTNSRSHSHMNSSDRLLQSSL